MKELIYLSHRIPYPPDKGDKIRSYNLLKRLADRWKVHLGAFVDDPADFNYVDELSAICEETTFIRINPLLSKALALRGLISGSSLTMPYYDHSRMRKWVARVLMERKIDSMVVFSSSMAQYLPLNDNSIRKVVDFCDVDSHKWTQYGERLGGLQRLIYKREGQRLGMEERQIAARIDASVFISSEEADLFRNLGAPDTADIRVVANGVDVEFFDPAFDFETPFAAVDKAFVFVGAMDYWPNIDAVSWFANDVFPSLRARVPEARFYIVGSNPGSQVESLQAEDGIIVTGRVEDVRPYVSHATAVVAPIRVARGVQNKVLEAMAMARPVIASRAAVEGILVDPDDGIQICKSTRDWLRALVDAASSNARGSAPDLRTYVKRNFSWDASAQRLTNIINGSSSQNRKESVDVAGAVDA